MARQDELSHCRIIAGPCIAYPTRKWFLSHHRGRSDVLFRLQQTVPAK